jgi:hypothetical protein
MMSVFLPPNSIAIVSPVLVTIRGSNNRMVITVPFGCCAKELLHAKRIAVIISTALNMQFSMSKNAYNHLTAGVDLPFPKNTVRRCDESIVWFPTFLSPPAERL